MSRHCFFPLLFICFYLGSIRSQENISCQTSRDCPPYYYCYQSLWSGSKCWTTFKVNRRAPSCASSDGQTIVPDHDACRRFEKGADNLASIEESTMRCFPSLNYKCSKAYFAPCTPNYDKRGNIIRGQEESCPEGFRCTRQTHQQLRSGLLRWLGFRHSETTVKVCVPYLPETYGSCNTAMDCGYSVLGDSWARCSRGYCARPVE